MAKSDIYSKTQAIILAAGRSRRFKTKKSKLLFNICGRTMILYPIKEVESLNIPMTLILGYQADAVKQEVLNAKVPNTSFVIQEEQKGTGHAVACSRSKWEKENLLVLCGDSPLITQEILSNLLLHHEKTNAAVTFCTSMVIDPTGYGRVIEESNVCKVVEEKDCTEEQKAINKINAGIYVFSKDFLENNIDLITMSNATNEIYLPSLIETACQQGKTVASYSVPYDNVRGVNTLQDLWAVEQIKRSEFIKYWMSEGVRFELAQSIHIDMNVKIGAGSFIGTGVHLLGNTTIGEECFVGAFSILENTQVGEGSNIHSHSVIQDSVVGKNVHVGPFARLRKDVTLGNDVLIGNFVEMKTVSMGEKTKTKHLTYLGDAKIGKEVNIGAGTITCNYDGIKQNKTVIGDEVFIGSNNTLIAPINVESQSYTAGGSTITEDVPSGSLAIGRSKQQLKEQYAKKFIEARKKAKQLKEEANKKKGETSDKEVNFKGAIKTKTEHSNSL